MQNDSIALPDRGARFQRAAFFESPRFTSGRFDHIGNVLHGGRLREMLVPQPIMQQHRTRELLSVFGICLQPCGQCRVLVGRERFIQISIDQSLRFESHVAPPIAALRSTHERS